METSGISSQEAPKGFKYSCHFALENISLAEKDAPLVLFRIRHGETNRLESKLALQAGQKDITEKGEKQIHEAVSEIADQYLHQGDVVVIISSPRKRAQDSANIAYHVLIQKGYTILGPKIYTELDATRLQQNSETHSEGSEEYAKIHPALLNKVDQSGGSMDAFFARFVRGEITDAPIEPYSDIQQRVRKWIAKLLRAHCILRNKYPTCKKRTVVLSFEHAETIEEDDYNTLGKGMGLTEKPIPPGGFVRRVYFDNSIPS